MEFVWIVKKNADQIEGRGPMVLDAIFATQELAKEYISQEGFPNGLEGTTYSDGVISYNGWYSITKTPIYHKIKTEKEKLIESALSKLSAKEKEALGYN